MQQLTENFFSHICQPSQELRQERRQDLRQERRSTLV